MGEGLVLYIEPKSRSTHFCFKGILKHTQLYHSVLAESHFPNCGSDFALLTTLVTLRWDIVSFNLRRSIVIKVIILPCDNQKGGKKRPIILNQEITKGYSDYFATMDCAR